MVRIVPAIYTKTPARALFVLAIICASLVSLALPSIASAAEQKVRSMRDIDQVKAYQYYHAVVKCIEEDGAKFERKTVNVGHLIDRGDGKLRCKNVITGAAQLYGFGSPEKLGLTRTSTGGWSGNDSVRSSIPKKMRDALYGGSNPGLSNAMKYVLYQKSFEIVCAGKPVPKGEQKDIRGEIIKTYKGGKMAEYFYPYKNDRGETSAVSLLAKTSGTVKNERQCKTLANFANQHADAYAGWAKDHASQSDVENAGEAAEGEDDVAASCKVEGLGWVICPAYNLLAKLNDAAFVFILANLLEVEGDLLSDNATRAAWQTFRNVANVLFVVVFVLIIYGQIVGGGGGRR
ncbi:hypothetical protein CR983_02880 [Candidatus Saccharibacteria bacterium]|nr:MAG: hypothetical protein CR983_02880 [Candidatus Saccharibacteria bacterium]